ncbi:MAG: CHASE3 domain-containing protein [Candidatus Binataceae bacterium]
MTYFLGSIAITANHEAIRDHARIEHFSETLSIMKDAETGQRGYLLTGDEKYLAPYLRALAEIKDNLQRLQRISEKSNGEALPPDEMASLNGLVDGKLDELRESIALRHTRGLDAALAVVNTDRGKHLMDSIRVKIAAIISREDSALAAANAHAESLELYRDVIFASLTLLTLVILGWAYSQIGGEIQRRETALRETQRQKDLFEVTLASIGDAVIVTDTRAQITFMNETAEKLTGWRRSDALEQPCESVFKIVQEDTRATVESPVEKVFRLGSIVGLANHTLLIRKDGTEVPIDDSGSPIKDFDGSLRGAVLIFRDFSVHRAAEARLRDSNAALQAANRAKDQFMAALSHELRTPLTPVLATLMTWEVSDELPPSLRSGVEMLRRNVQLEARIIDDLLDLTRITKGKLSLNPEVVDAHDLVENVVAMYRSDINAKHLTLSEELDAKRYHVNADSARLQQVFANILNNAIKFVEPNGRIRIFTANDSEGNLQISFVDDGIGIAQDALDRIFTPFEQETEEITRRYGGLGLGLAVSKSLVDAHGGNLTAASAGPHLGSTFTVTLPSLDSDAEARSRKSNAYSANHDGAGKGCSILFVEDHQDTAEVMSGILRSHGYLVQTCATVSEATRLARENNFDLVLSDVGLPDGTGIDLIRAIRLHSTVPAIALTGFGMDQDVASFREAGFNVHLTKPVNLQRLLIAINDLTVSQKSTEARTRS